jgi:hypothetical protein
MEGSLFKLTRTSIRSNAGTRQLEDRTRQMESLTSHDHTFLRRLHVRRYWPGESIFAILSCSRARPFDLRARTSKDFFWGSCGLPNWLDDLNADSLLALAVNHAVAMYPRNVGHAER